MTAENDNLTTDQVAADAAPTPEDSALPAENEATPQDDQQPAPQAENGEEQPGGLQKRINKITADKYAYRRRAEEAERKLKETEQAKTLEQPNHFGAGGNTQPTLEKFDYDEGKYQEALIDWKVRAHVSEARKQEESRLKQSERLQLERDYAQKVKKANISGFQEAAEQLVSTVPLRDSIISLIQKDPKGPELVHYLGSNLDVADQIAGENDLSVAMELGRISANLSRQQPKKTTQAPPPPQTGAGAGAGVATKNFSEMTAEDVAKYLGR